jgi:hypothetical protein
MDQINLIKKLRDCFIHPNVLKLLLEWLDGRKENILFEPYLIGRNIDSQWTFIYGRIPEKNQVIYIPVQYIVSFEETGDSFSFQDKHKYFFLSTNENIKVMKSLPDIQIEDLSDTDVKKDKDDFDQEEVEVDEEEDEDEDSEYYKQPCTYCDAEDGCEHLVFLYDRSFTDCIAGCCDELKNIRTTIRSTFLAWLKDGKVIDLSRKEINDHLCEMWENASDNFKKGDDDVDVDYDNFSDLIKETIEEDFEPVFTHGSGGGPGMDSQMWVCYSQDPKKLMLEVENIIKEYLGKMIQTK